MRSTSRLSTIAATVALALALAGCAGGQADTADAEVEPAAVADEAGEPDADAGPDADAATDTVEARNIDFEPADIEVEVGTTVTWTNEDIVNHTVTSGPAGDPDGVFDEPLASGGDDVTVTFDEPGTFAYHCDLHRNMVGSVTVTG